MYLFYLSICHSTNISSNKLTSFYLHTYTIPYAIIVLEITTKKTSVFSFWELIDLYLHTASFLVAIF